MKTQCIPICFSMYAASSGVARGITPGSLKLVRNKADITKINNKPPMTGIAGVMFSAKNGQLKSIIKINICQIKPWFKFRYDKNTHNLGIQILFHLQPN